LEYKVGYNSLPCRARNDIFRASKRFRRANWKHWSGYHARSRIEAKVTGYPRQLRL